MHLKYSIPEHVSIPVVHFGKGMHPIILILSLSTEYRSFEIQGNSKFVVIYLSHSFSLCVKFFKKFLTPVENLMFALSNGLKIVSTQQCYMQVHKHLNSHTHFFQQGTKANS